MAVDDLDERDTYLRRMCRISVVIIILSSVCVVVGCLSIAESAPKFLFPYSLGGAMIAGVFVMSLAACNIKLYCNYIENNEEHSDEDTVKRWVWRQIILISLTGIALVLGIGLSGIWGMVKATDVINFEAKFNMTTKADVPYAKANLPYAVTSFVLVLVLSIVQMVLWCTCLCYTDTYGFTDNTSYHRYRARPRQTLTSRVPTYEYRPRIAQDNAHSGHLTSNSNHSNNTEELRVTIPGGYNQRPVPSAPPTASRDMQDNRSSIYRSSHTDDSYNVAGQSALNDNASASDGGLPPPYEQVSEEPPPSYDEVLKEGAFKVSYV